MSKGNYQAVATEDDLRLVLVTQENQDGADSLSSAKPETPNGGSGPEFVESRLNRRQQRLNTELLDAVESRDLEAIQRLLEKGAEVNAVCRDSGLSSCHIAALNGQEKVLQTLLSRNVIQKPDDRGHYPIHYAAWNGHEAILELLKPFGLDIKITEQPVSERDELMIDLWDHSHEHLNSKIPTLQRGSTPLHLSSQKAHARCVEMLINSGAKISITDDRGLTPVDVTGELVETYYHHPYRHSLCGSSRKDGPPIFRSVFRAPSNGGSANQDTGREETETRLNLDDSEPGDSVHEDQGANSDLLHKVLNLFILTGAQFNDIQTVNDKKMTPLHTAVLKGNLMVIELLLENNVDTTILNQDGLAPIHLAIQEQQQTILKALLDSGLILKLEINLRSAKGLTPLHMAVFNEWENGVSLLLEAGAKITVQSSDTDNTALHFAAEKGNCKILKELLTFSESKLIIDAQNKIGHTPLMVAVISGSPECVEALLSYGADVNVTLPNDVTILHLAAQQGFCPVLDLILSHDPDKTKKLMDVKDTLTGITPLHSTAMRGFTDCVKSLLAHGANVYVKTADMPHYGGNALHLSSRKGHASVVKALLDHDKALVDSLNSDKWYPLHIAARFGHRNCAKLIILAGGNLSQSVKDVEGISRTAIDILLWCLPQPVKLINQLLNSSIEVNGFPLNHAKCVVKLHYDILFPAGDDSRQMKVLAEILNSNHRQLRETALPHPLVETFLHFKWKKLGGIFLAFVLIYTLFTVSLTARALCLYVFHPSEYLISTVDALCQLVLLVTFPIIVIKELLHASQQQRYYWSDFEFWLKWSVLILTLFTVVSADFGVGSEKMEKHATSLAVLLAWINLLVTLSRFPSWGLHVVMFSTVAQNFIHVVCAFFVLLLGFTFAFLIQFEGSPPFDNFWEALMKVIVMTSEFDYGSMFSEESKADPLVGKLIFILFIVLVAVVLMNLLVGLAVSDIASLEAQGNSERLGKQVDFLSLIEGFVYSESVLKFCPNSARKWIHKKISVPRGFKMYPGRPLDESLPGNMKESVLQNLRSSIRQGSKLSETNSTKSYESESDLGEGSEDEDMKAFISDVLNELQEIRVEIENIKKQS